LLVKSLVLTNKYEISRKVLPAGFAFSIRIVQTDITGLKIAIRCAKAYKNDVVSQVTMNNTESHNYSYPKLHWIPGILFKLTIH